MSACPHCDRERDFRACTGTAAAWLVHYCCMLTVCVCVCARTDVYVASGGAADAGGAAEEATAYVINGLESNIAAGSGLRIIRWLRHNELCT